MMGSLRRKILRKQLTTELEEQIRNSKQIAFNIPLSTKSWRRETIFSKLSIIIKHVDFIVQSGEVAFENLTVLKFRFSFPWLEIVYVCLS